MNTEFDYTDHILFYDVLYNNGVVFSKDTFKLSVGTFVPIVWSYDVIDRENICGMALLEDCDDGMVAKCIFTKDSKGRLIKKTMEDTKDYGLSFYANKVRRNGRHMSSGIISAVLLLPKGGLVGYTSNFAK